MPQVWLTDVELGNELDRPEFVARATAISNGWTRKKSLDGLSRTRLPDTMMIAFILKAAQRLARSEPCVDDRIGKFRSAPDKSPLALLWSKIA
jgi:hypothetical protein